MFVPAVHAGRACAAAGGVASRRPAMPATAHALPMAAAMTLRRGVLLLIDCILSFLPAPSTAGIGHLRLRALPRRCCSKNSDDISNRQRMGRGSTIVDSF